MGENGDYMGENKFRILEKTSPILHSSFIIHRSSFSLPPLLLNSFVLHFFKPLNSYLYSYFLEKTGHAPPLGVRSEIAYFA